MKSVYLDWLAERNEFSVSDADYWNTIRPLVMKLRICATYAQYFDPEADPPRPCVGLRICLQCFLQKHPGLQLLEVKSVNGIGESTYTFIDQAGAVYTAIENHSAELRKDISSMLAQHAFTLPERYQPAQAAEEMALDVSAFQVYGDIPTASVLVAAYIDPATKQSYTFFLYKNGGYKALPKGREGRVLLERAEAMLLRTRQPDGSYLINGKKQSKISEGDIYTVLSQMESAYHSLSMQYAAVGTPEPLPEQQPAKKTSPIVLQRARERARRSREKQLRIVASQQPTPETTDTVPKEHPDTDEPSE